MTTLDSIAIKYGTDKSSKHHNYTKLYADYFKEFRYKSITVLELGVGGHENPKQGGASLRTWQEFFPNGLIIGVDNEKKDLQLPVRVVTYLGSQDDPDLIERIRHRHGRFDIVIDDASHVSSLTIDAFKAVYPHLKPGGLYVCEDTHMAYHRWYYGENEAHPDPDGQLPNGKLTAMQFFRRMADEVNYHGNWEQEDGGDLFPREFWKGYCLEWAHFYYNILFLKKGWWANEARYGDVQR